MDPTGSPFRRPPARPVVRPRRTGFGPVPAAPLTAATRNASAARVRNRGVPRESRARALRLGAGAFYLVAAFTLLGFLAQRGQLWAFAVGAAVYGLDGLIVLAAHDWLGVAIHTVVLVMMVRGLDAGRRRS